MATDLRAWEKDITVRCGPPKLIIITWSAMDGLQKTGRQVLRDGVWRDEYAACKAPRALVWSSRMSDLDAGREYAKQNGYTVRILPDSADVLDRARRLEFDGVKGD